MDCFKFTRGSAPSLSAVGHGVPSLNHYLLRESPSLACWHEPTPSRTSRRWSDTGVEELSRTTGRIGLLHRQREPQPRTSQRNAVHRPPPIHVDPLHAPRFARASCAHFIRPLPAARAALHALAATAPVSPPDAAYRPLHLTNTTHAFALAPAAGRRPPAALRSPPPTVHAAHAAPTLHLRPDADLPFPAPREWFSCMCVQPPRGARGPASRDTRHPPLAHTLHTFTAARALTARHPLPARRLPPPVYRLLLPAACHPPPANCSPHSARRSLLAASVCRQLAPTCPSPARRLPVTVRARVEQPAAPLLAARWSVAIACFLLHRALSLTAAPSPAVCRLPHAKHRTPHAACHCAPHVP
ncbi:hypothetical protein GGX14DRAFT_572324 [Mycena pura]|uniref:Uncharacterized protein n=1 Tax=Mycena pura TaxID=153505 RepID=A0AAD6V1F4_9AGAR|nr:hypothetical protein GGX14DRAFT_572324 [Mycena pura]